MEIAGCPLPEDRLYDLENDVWWMPDPSGGTARVGLLATLGAFAGPIQSVTFRDVSGTVGPGRSVATIESFRLVGAVRLPVEGAIVDRNEEVVSAGSTANYRLTATGACVLCGESNCKRYSAAAV